MSGIDYRKKYIKYKNKYEQLKYLSNMRGGVPPKAGAAGAGSAERDRKDIELEKMRAELEASGTLWPRRPKNREGKGLDERLVESNEKLERIRRENADARVRRKISDKIRDEQIDERYKEGKEKIKEDQRILEAEQDKMRDYLKHINEPFKKDPENPFQSLRDIIIKAYAAANELNKKYTTAKTDDEKRFIEPFLMKANEAAQSADKAFIRAMDAHYKKQMEDIMLQKLEQDSVGYAKLLDELEHQMKIYSAQAKKELSQGLINANVEQYIDSAHKYIDENYKLLYDGSIGSDIEKIKKIESTVDEYYKAINEDIKLVKPALYSEDLVDEITAYEFTKKNKESVASIKKHAEERADFIKQRAKEYNGKYIRMKELLGVILEIFGINSMIENVTIDSEQLRVAAKENPIMDRIIQMTDILYGTIPNIHKRDKLDAHAIVGEARTTVQGAKQQVTEYIATIVGRTVEIQTYKALLNKLDTAYVKLLSEYAKKITLYD